MKEFFTEQLVLNEKTKDIIETIGDYLQFLTPIFYLCYSLAHNSHYETVVFVLTFVLGLCISSLLKAIFNNERPYETDSTDNPDLNVDWSPRQGNSFPSGHTLSAMLGGLFWFQINPWFGCVGVALGCFTGFSRMVANAHWLRDILGAVTIAVTLYSIAVIYFL